MVKLSRIQKPIFKFAFTLVELLVVIAIIGILATLAIVSIQNTRSKARDTKRIADVKQIQTALELYFNDNGSYPVSTSVTSSIRSLNRSYMEGYPQAPNPPDGDCTEENNQYVYTEAGEDNGSYALSFCLGNSVSDLTAGTKVARPIGITELFCSDSFGCGETCLYEGEYYPTVQIGTQCWMKKNINIGVRINGNVNQLDNNIIEKYCVANNASNCDIYGGLYQWGEAMKYSTTEKSQGICPSGWYIPTRTEFITLYNYHGGTAPPAICRLKNTSQDYPTWEGTNDHDFSLVPSGCVQSGAVYGPPAYYLAALWSSTISGADAFCLYIRSSCSQYIDIYALSQEGYGDAVRCIKD